MAACQYCGKPTGAATTFHPRCRDAWLHDHPGEAPPSPRAEPPPVRGRAVRQLPSPPPAQSPPAAAEASAQRVVITGIRVTFDEMVRLALKWWAATLVAALLIGLPILFLSFVLRACGSP